MLRRSLVHIIPRLPVSTEGVVIGGSAASLVALIRSQQQVPEHEVALVAGRTRTDASARALFGYSEIQVHNLRMWSPPVTRRYGIEFTARALTMPLQQFRRSDHLIVQGHSGHWPYALGVRLLAMRLRSPWVHTLYCPVGGRVGFQSAAGQWIRRTLSRASAIVGISKNIVRSIESAGVNPGMLCHIDPCIDVQRYQPRGASERVRRLLMIPPLARVVLFVGNTEHTKGFNVLWDAFKQLSTSIRDLYLVATFEARGSSYQMSLDQELDHPRRDRVRFLGIVDDMPSLMEAADVLALPFRSTDGPSDYPLPMLEAMAVGTPVIASDVGGISEVIKNEQTGLLVRPGDPDDLTRALEDLLTGVVAKERLAEGARDLVYQRFTPEVVTEEWSRLYAQL